MTFKLFLLECSVPNFNSENKQKFNLKKYLKLHVFYSSYLLSHLFWTFEYSSYFCVIKKSKRNRF